MKRVLVAALIITAGVGGQMAPAASLQRPTTLVLGASRIVVPRGATIGVQVDRVIRDVAWTASPWDERVAPGRVPAKPEDLVPYMEGFLVGQLMRHAAASILPLTPGVARLNPDDGIWYASDGQGRFRFAIDGSKAESRSVRRLAADMIEMPDTHGFNSIAAAAVRARPYLAVACLDLPSKADAALYLAEQGIHAYGATDRFAYRLLGYRLHRPRAAGIVGSAPIRPGPDGSAVIGGQPVEIRLGETVVAQSTDSPGPWQYNDTPWSYFAALVDRYFLDIPLVRVKAEAGQLERVLAEARARDANVVAVRVGKATTMDEATHDAEVLAAWLQESPHRRAVLFHSAPYEPGYQLFFAFPTQTTFGDVDPVLK